MTPIELLYAIAGVVAIVLIVGAIAFDAIALGQWARRWGSCAMIPPPSTMSSPWYLVGLSVVLIAWLGAAWLR